MKTYLEIKVPIKYDDSWFERLRNHFAGIPVRWQKDFYHITMVFVNETLEGVELGPILEKHFSAAHAPVLTFDRIEAFSVKSGTHIIHLSASHVPESFLALTEAVREDMTAVGCVILSDFMLHVTLGRLRYSNIKISRLRRMASSFSFSPFTLALTDVDYRVFRGKVLYEAQLQGSFSINCRRSSKS